MTKKLCVLSTTFLLSVVTSALASGPQISYTCSLSHSVLKKSQIRCDLKAHDGSRFPSECIQIVYGSRKASGGVAYFRVIKEGQGTAIEYAYVPAPLDTSRAYENLTGKNIVGKVYPSEYGATFLLPTGPVLIDGYTSLGSQAVAQLEDSSEIVLSCSTLTHPR